MHSFKSASNCLEGMSLLSLVVIVIGLTAIAGLTQTITASLSGTVHDPSAAAIPKATVTLISTQTGQRWEFTTGNDGSYLFPNLAPREYSLRVSVPGFKTKVLERFVLEVNVAAKIDVTLELGAASEVVEVEAKTPVVDNETANIGEVIDNRKVVELPLNGRQFMQLALLTPGTTPWHGGHGQLRGGGPRGVGVNIGGREDQNNFLIDGIESFGYRFKNTTVRPSVELIQEFKVAQAPYDARFGTAGYGQINLVTKSGSNDLHGSVYEFLRNDIFDARNFFDAKKPAYRQNQFGGVVAGPVTKDRTFFLASYEGLRVRQGLAAPAQVPTQSQRNGDFSNDPAPILDPLTGSPFPGNIIPAARISPTSKRFLDFYPLPNTGLAAPNFINSESLHVDEDQFTVRLDHSLSQRWRLYGRYTWQDTDQLSPGGIPSFGVTNKLTGQNFVLNAIFTASPTFLIDLRLGYNREFAINSSTQVGKQSVSDFGIPGLNPPADVDGVPFVTVQGFSAVGDVNAAPETRAENSENLVADFTKIKGRHTLVWGSFVRPAQLNRVFVVANQRGNFQFTSFLGGSTGLSEFLLGYPFLTQRTNGLSRHDGRGWAFAFYGMDTFRISPRVTLSYGLRYELRQPWVDQDNTIATVVNGNLIVAGNPNNGFAGRKNRSLYDYTTTNFLPRFSLAFDPIGDARTSIRAGYGMYSNQSQFNGANFIGTLNPPFSVTELFLPLTGGLLTWNNAFPTGGQLVSPPVVIAVKHDYRDALIQHWSLGVSRELAPNLGLDISYVGSKADHVDTTIMGDPGGAPGSAPGTTPYVKNYPQFTAIVEAGDRGRDVYHSLQSKLSKRFSHGLTALVSYTYAHAINYNGGFNAVGLEYAGYPQDSRNLRAERASSDFDIKHRGVISTVYELPFGPQKQWGRGTSGATAKLIGGWNVSGLWSLQTGFPLTANDPRNRSNTLGLGDRPNCISEAVPDGFNQTRERWFDTSAFSVQTLGTFGSCGRNTVRGPGVNNFDFNLFKDTHLSETSYIQFRAEFFNLWNHTNFGSPGMSIAAPQLFGVITSAQAPRIIQFGLKFIF